MHRTLGMIKSSLLNTDFCAESWGRGRGLLSESNNQGAALNGDTTVPLHDDCGLWQEKSDQGQQMMFGWLWQCKPVWCHTQNVGEDSAHASIDDGTEVARLEKMVGNQIWTTWKHPREKAGKAYRRDDWPST